MLNHDTAHVFKFTNLFIYQPAPASHTANNTLATTNSDTTPVYGQLQFAIAFAKLPCLGNISRINKNLKIIKKLYGLHV